MNNPNDIDIFPWNEFLDTGIEIIDEQHKRLVNSFNLLLKAKVETVKKEQKLQHIFNELIDYTHYHFQTEEQIWLEFGLQDSWYIEHKTSHQAFIEKLQILKESFEHSSIDETIDKTISFLVQWLAEHILNSDKKMALAISALSSGLSLDKAKEQAEKAINNIYSNAIITIYEDIAKNSIYLFNEYNRRIVIEKQLQLKQQEEKKLNLFILDNLPCLVCVLNESLELIK